MIIVALHRLLSRLHRSAATIGVAIGLIADAGDIESIGEKLL